LTRTCIAVAVVALCTFLLSAQEPPRPVLVTVDDLPIAGGSLHTDPAERERITRDVLEVLRRHDIQAVGLVTWGNVRGPDDLELLEQWLEAGHELGNHSWRHMSYTSTDSETYVSDIEAARAELQSFLEDRGHQLRYFRFPMLREGDTTAKLEAMRIYLGESGQLNLPVTIDNQDYAFERPWVEARRAGDDTAMARVAEAYHESLHLSVRHHERTGDRLFGRRVPQILLLHAGEVGAAQWDRLFTWLTRTGHRFASADEVLADPAFSVEHAYVGPRGFGLWDRIRHERWLARARAEVEELLQAEAAAWNRGDLSGFVDSYADDAVFVTPKGITRGRQAVLERYRQSYPDPASMGSLSLDTVQLRLITGTEVSMLGDAAPGRVHGASVVARWRLEYSDGREPASGLTLLVLHRTPAGWRVVHDASM
jgi:peptidoglycan/xylan/chitin deacetylase (PgdA/CDA1 family)/ketosteroid isomerase-like protein